jgi:hypothetical protein
MFSEQSITRRPSRILGDPVDGPSDSCPSDSCGVRLNVGVLT